MSRAEEKKLSGFALNAMAAAIEEQFCLTAEDPEAEEGGRIREARAFENSFQQRKQDCDNRLKQSEKDLAHFADSLKGRSVSGGTTESEWGKQKKTVEDLIQQVRKAAQKKREENSLVHTQRTLEEQKAILDKGRMSAQNKV